ncbi:MAG: class I SAM-dependent methyltransferase [Anaerolineaceae bacterium]|nr:class I SAM-dependent methyltransferase [Anaerolineaceae bacterium]
MSPLVTVIALIFIVGFAAWWLLIDTEGVYLGKRVVIWLYDVYASRYDNIKQYDDVEEHLYLAQPLLAKLPATDPMVLDVATGTGRLPLALCQHARFEGHIIGVELSRKMITQAAEKIANEHFHEYVTLLWADGTALPFPDDSFDVVTCMEALEFMPEPKAALDEIIRVLRSGGLLLTTRRINAYMPSRLWEEKEMADMLAERGIVGATFQTWHTDYELVWGQKAGHSPYIGVIPPHEVMHCPRCQQQAILDEDSAWRCSNCNLVVPCGTDGVVEVMRAK